MAKIKWLLTTRVFWIVPDPSLNSTYQTILEEAACWCYCISSSLSKITYRKIVIKIIYRYTNSSALKNIQCCKAWRNRIDSKRKCFRNSIRFRIAVGQLAKHPNIISDKHCWIPKNFPNASGAYSKCLHIRPFLGQKYHVSRNL